MATNAEDKTVADDDTNAEEDLRSLKYGKDEVETSQEEDESTESEESEDEAATSEEDGQTDDQTEDEDSEETDETESDEEPSEFVKEFPYIKGDTPEDYARNLEAAYKNSSSEALRLKRKLDDSQTEDTETSEETIDTSNPLNLYMKQKMDEEITVAFSDFSKRFPQVNDPNEYNKFTQEVSVFSNAILNSQKRLASPKELYDKAAVSLGWQPDDKADNKDKLGMAIKGQAAVTKTSSSTKKAPKSKVSDAEVAIAKQMWGGGKSDAEIRKELEQISV